MTGDLPVEEAALQRQGRSQGELTCDSHKEEAVAVCGSHWYPFTGFLKICVVINLGIEKVFKKAKVCYETGTAKNVFWSLFLTCKYINLYKWDM